VIEVFEVALDDVKLFDTVVLFVPELATATFVDVFSKVVNVLVEMSGVGLEVKDVSFTVSPFALTTMMSVSLSLLVSLLPSALTNVTNVCFAMVVVPLVVSTIFVSVLVLSVMFLLGASAAIEVLTVCPLMVMLLVVRVELSLAVTVVISG
jgi:hypothetical protein